ncbi:hypothetical protein [Streptomyces sp. NPDC000410]|uniref:effector-associated domain 2-containing protein n=1 Tax=Streptomyces sp. NPDC000410 TaxID=3154254 RepID=UPI00332BDD3B
MGVEAYEAGSAWNLDGPADDALAYARWLWDLGLARDDVTLLLSPLPRNRAAVESAAASAGARFAPADRETVHRTLFRELAAASGEWLFVSWSGHGLVDPEGRRRLLYADAVHGDLRCLDLDAALAAFRSDVAPSHPRQLWLIDACQTFADPAATAGALRPDPVPRGTLRSRPDQQVLFACGPGEAAAGRAGAAADRRSGVFTGEALALLRENPGWREESHLLAETLRVRFQASSARGETRQLPTSLWFEGAAGARRTTIAAPAPAPPRPRRLGTSDHRRLYEALAAVPVMRDPGTRGAVMNRLPAEIAGSVPRSGVMRIEILELVDTCLAFRDGLTRLWEALSLLDAGTEALAALHDVFEEYPEWFNSPHASGN